MIWTTLMMAEKYGWNFLKALHRWTMNEIDDLEGWLYLHDRNVWLWFGKATNLYETDDLDQAIEELLESF